MHRSRKKTEKSRQSSLSVKKEQCLDNIVRSYFHIFGRGRVPSNRMAWNQCTRDEPCACHPFLTPTRWVCSRMSLPSSSSDLISRLPPSSAELNSTAARDGSRWPLSHDSGRNTMLGLRNNGLVRTAVRRASSSTDVWGRRATTVHLNPAGG
jgi:hypothetical protein